MQRPMTGSKLIAVLECSQARRQLLGRGRHLQYMTQRGGHLQYTKHCSRHLQFMTQCGRHLRYMTRLYMGQSGL